MTQLELFPIDRPEQLALVFTYTSPKGPPMIRPLRVIAVSGVAAFFTLPTVAALALIFTR